MTQPLAGVRVLDLSNVLAGPFNRDSAPLRVGFPVSDAIAGMTAAFAISAALVDQRASGRDRHIDVSLLESTLATMGRVVSNHLNAGVDPQPIGDDHFTAAPSGTFRTATGPLNASANEQKQSLALRDLIARPDLPKDPRFAERQARKTHRTALNAEIDRALAARSAETSEAMMNAAGVPAGRVRTVGEILRSEQIVERRFVEALARDGTPDDQRTLRVTRPGLRFDSDFPAPPAPPDLGADTRSWIERLGYSPIEIERLLSTGAARAAGGGGGG